MRDFTLVIPTYNRPKQLAAFLGYLEAQQAECQILILDSSTPQQRAVNRRTVGRAVLDAKYAEFPSDIHPFDKFREGTHRVTTQLCALCADDDLVVLPGVKRCLDALRGDPQASVAQGYSFAFQCRPDGSMELGRVLYFSSTIDDASPLKRLAKLFARYQAATYGCYRTPLLQRIFDTLKPANSLLARELLGTALAAIEGRMLRVDCFSHGRSMDPSETYHYWHPLEWFAKDSNDLFSEYRPYRELMAEAVLKQPGNQLDPVAVRRFLDLIHLRYMAQHAPDDALSFIIESKTSGVSFDEYWPQQEIQLPLQEAARLETPALASSRTTTETCLRLRSRRLYELHPNFCAALDLRPSPSDTVTDLLPRLDDYRWRPPARLVPTQPHRPVRARVTVSVLLCNYNNARYLPDSLGALCSQTRPADEVILLDDGSTDESLEIIEDFARRFPFIRVLKNEINRGLLYSINRALNESRCDFVVWAAADDRLMPNFLEHNVRYLRKFATAGMTFSRLAVFPDGSDEITSFTEANHGAAFDYGTEAHFLSPAMLQQRLQRSHLWISANTVVANRQALVRAGGFDPQLRWHADYFAFLAIAFRQGVCCIPETLAVMRQRDETYSSRGMANYDEQRVTLGFLADRLTTKGWRDVGIAVLCCPSVLSPFGGLMLRVLLRKPRRWPFVVTYGLWWANHQWGQRSETAAVMGARLAHMALRGILPVLKGAIGFVLSARRT
jgi:glycosyltransferase domain-containing protein